MGLERDKLQPERYAYLSQRHSDLYDAAKASGTDEAGVIMMLIEELAQYCRANHCMSNR